MSGESFPRLDPPDDCCLVKFPDFIKAKKIECPLGMSSKVGMILPFKIGTGSITPSEVWRHIDPAEGKPKGFLYHSNMHDCYCVIEAAYSSGSNDTEPEMSM